MIGTQISHYTLVEMLGDGTYGAVYKGVHVEEPEFSVAIKVVSAQVRNDPSFVRALKKECRALDRLDHANIVRFRELAIGEGHVAMVMELLEGTDLEGLLTAGPQPLAEVGPAHRDVLTVQHQFQIRLGDLRGHDERRAKNDDHEENEG